MRESPYPLERYVGMRCYASDTPGIGGRLRERAEDFAVDEVSFSPGKTGPYLICRLTKRNWEMQRAAREIARKLSISHRRVSWTGTKDTHALTSQLIALYNVTEDEVARVSLKDIEIVPVGRSEHPLALGDHIGNKFSITIRDCHSPDLGGEVAAVTETCCRGIPNYFGIQRFGVVRPITHLVGLHILRGDLEGAVNCYVGKACPAELPGTRAARQEYLQSQDPAAALRSFPVTLTYERAMLHYLVSHPGDYRGALFSLPPRLLSLFVSAFQSCLYNCVLSTRMERQPDFSSPEPGDWLLFADGREDRVTPPMLQTARALVSRGRCSVAIRIPGAHPPDPGGEDDRVMASLLEQYGISHGDFARASELIGTRYEGALRPVPLRTTVTSQIEGTDVTLSFELGPGQYATTVCREFMKADPAAMV
ncbi:MAG: tRNA pseudouridine(13) synthase TruD [Methanolinea sp.]|nr:tRNA pseudouridine(13) synthase TruD [Methanolinea sp.]